ncbi:MAG: hypothetical protein P8I94_06335 [Emcibacteraceae bacterium]|nr:hypothetical protein [Emcibacteraceae bacterium]
METNTKLITWITAIAIGFTIAGPLNAKERGDRGGNRGSKVIVTQQAPIYDNYRGRSNNVIIRGDRRNHNAYGQPQRLSRKMIRKQKRKQARKMRRMRRIAHKYDNLYERRYEPRYEPRYAPRYEQRRAPVYDRPVIIIPVPYLR